jgi:hypothetical protein
MKNFTFVEIERRALKKLSNLLKLNNLFAGGNTYGE